MVLTPDQAKAFYDRFGSKQDAQSFYEDGALDDLVNHSQFNRAQSVFEIGCGTGRLAFRLLSGYLPSSASYFGIDSSETMTRLATQRLAPFSERARAVLSDGSMHFPLPDHSLDRVVSTYVLDLLSEQDIRHVLAETYRLLRPGGKLCLVSLTDGATLVSRIVSGLWSTAFRLRPSLVGGCRPICLESYLQAQQWSIDYHNVVAQLGIASEVLVATPEQF